MPCTNCMVRLKRGEVRISAKIQLMGHWNHNQ